MCGVRITLSRPRSGHSNSSSLDRGSTGNTSMAAPIRCFSLIASARASSSTTVPREALIRMPPVLMARISFADHPLGCGGFRYVQGDDVGHGQQVVQLPTCVALPSGSLVTMS